MPTSGQMLMPETPVWFGDDHRRLFGWLHVPADGNARLGVVLCPPVGQEYRNSYGTFQLLAGQLQDLGCVALRYDHPGTGDSASGTKEQGWIADWCAGVHRAVELVRATGCREVVVVGMRIGAAVAALEASELAPLRGLVLWDPVVSGRRFLREQQVLSSVAAGESDVATAGEFVEGPGIVLPKELGEKLDWLDGPPLSGTDRLLVLTRNGRTLKRLKSWSTATEIELAEAKGQTDLLQLASPLYLIPHETVAFIAAWIYRIAGPAAISVSAAGERSSVVDRPRGSTIIEEAIRFGPGLFAMSTRPEGKARGPVVVFVNEAIDHHIGPGRLWVDLSRTLAGAGIRSLRMDLSGLGDSAARDGVEAGVAHSLAAFDDMEVAARTADPANPRNVVLVGLCSAGYQCLEAALVQRPIGVVAVNPILDFVPPEMLDGTSDMDPIRKFCIPPVTIVKVARLAPRAVAFAERFPNLTWRVRHLLSRRNVPVQRLGALIEAGVSTLLVCGELESTALRQSGPHLMNRLERTGQFHMETVPDVQHSLPTHRMRELVGQLVTDFVLGLASGMNEHSSDPSPVGGDHERT